jgi:hypothetical protein
MQDFNLEGITSKQQKQDETIDSGLNSLLKNFELMELSSTSLDINTLKKEMMCLYKEIDTELKSYGKKIDTSFATMQEWTHNEVDPVVLHPILFRYFCHHGNIEMAHLFCQESGFTGTIPTYAGDLHFFNNQLKSGTVEGVKKWLERNIPESYCLFLIHQKEYLDLIHLSEHKKAVEYSRTYLTAYYQTYPKGIANFTQSSFT